MTDRLLVGLCLVLAGLLACYQVHNYDIGFHLATGRYILEYGFPSTNVLSFAQPDHSWPLHYGLSTVLLSGVFDVGGYVALSLLRMVLVTAAFMFVLAAARAAGANTRVAVVVVMLAVVTAALRFQVRPHLFTHVLLAAFLHQLFLWRACANRSHLMGAAAIAVLGANLHAGAVYMLLLLLALACVVAVSKGWRQSVVLFGCAMGIIAGATATVMVYNPMGLDGLLVPFQFGANPTLNHVILEFRGIGLTSQAEYPFFWFLAAFSAAGLLATKHRSDLWLWALTVGGIAAPVRHQRLLFLGALCLAPVAAVVWTTLLQRFRVVALNRVGPVLAGASMLVLAATGVTHYANDHVFGLGLNETEFPRGALEFVDGNQLHGSSFTTDVFSGAYLERFSPDRRVFYDNRMEAYDVDFIQRAYIPLAYGLKGWRAIADRFQIDVFVIAYSSGDEQTSALSAQLNSDPSFSLVYFDDNAMVWLRHTPSHADLIERLSYRNLNPDRFATGDNSVVDGLELDLRSAVQRPESPALAWWYLGLLLRDTQRVSEALELLQDGRQRHPEDARLITLMERLEQRGAARGVSQ